MDKYRLVHYKTSKRFFDKWYIQKYTMFKWRYVKDLSSKNRLKLDSLDSANETLKDLAGSFFIEVHPTIIIQ